MLLCIYFNYFIYFIMQIVQEYTSVQNYSSFTFAFLSLFHYFAFLVHFLIYAASFDGPRPLYW